MRLWSRFKSIFRNLFRTSRVENQLGYKMVKWIERIEFIESEKQVGAGEGGKNEDDEYFDLLPNI